MRLLAQQQGEVLTGREAGGKPLKVELRFDLGASTPVLQELAIPSKE
jgi:hypothetical protein